MLPKKQNSKKILINFTIFIFLSLFALTIFIFRQRIIDQVVFWQYKPSSDISSLTNRLSLTELGTFSFYSSQPELQSASDFNQSCSRIENTVSILGCYSQSKIYIYNILDEKLNGIREVTAAHEMLHAVYQRLSDGEKNEIGSLLENEYVKLQKDEAFVDLIEFYEKTEPGERQNELFSVIGTTVANIDEKLESYYKKYFVDRQQIVSYNNKYNKVFKDLSDRAAVLAAQIKAYNDSMPGIMSKYNSDVKVLNKDIENFNERASSGYFKTWSQFYAEKSTIEQRVSVITQTRTTINSDIEKYNSALTEYNSIAVESQKLYSSIDSTLESAGSLE